MSSNYLTSTRGLRPRLHTLDNEASTILRDYLRSEDVEYQLVPPHISTDEMPPNAPSAPSRTILLPVSQAPTPTFPFRTGAAFYHKPNSRLISSAPLASTPSCRPMHNSRAHSISHAHPLSPPGTRVIIHENPPIRQTWAPHGTDGWYVGPALHHYQCYRIWVPRTHAERIVDTISFFPKTIPTTRPYP